jgi:crotonobetainyl-CoA:carnitine CoA-transferase CaiB-like acyl-CoA transferase
MPGQLLFIQSAVCAILIACRNNLAIQIYPECNRMKPLQGLKILEFSTMVTASFAAMMMAEQGAEVIKVEPLLAGDPMRYLGTSKGGISALFGNCNRGKSSIRVDLKQAEGQATIRQLASQVDVVIHNYRPGVMDKLNLGSAALRDLNPRLVYMAISGFGTQGPLSSAPAYDPIIQAHAGFSASQGLGSPTFIRNLMCDKITAYTACQAVTAALYQRERTGEGQHIDLSMLDAGLFFIFPDGFMNHTLLDDDVQQQPLLADLLYNISNTLDGGITLSAGTPKQRAGVLKAIGQEALLSDPRFATMEDLTANLAEYRAILAAAFAKFTTVELLTRLADNDVPCARCHDYAEVLEQPQLQANDSIAVAQHPLMGAMRVVKSPARFGGARSQPSNAAPAHGENTQACLEGCGFSPEQQSALRAQGVIE